MPVAADWCIIRAGSIASAPAMSQRPDYTRKFAQIAPRTGFRHLSERDRRHVQALAHRHRFTLQELRTVSEIAQDLRMWRQGDILEHWPLKTHPAGDKARKQRLIRRLRDRWESLRHQANRYPPGHDSGIATLTPQAMTHNKGRLGLGACPVASPRTRCCNLLTLDAVDNCGYGCSYCSIQSFYDGKEISFDRDFARKLATLEIDPERIYHIGTGQSSDSLMWGNSHGVLEALLAFADRHPNVILEFKTKSANVKYLLEHELPPNVICTWSLNTPTIIANEEHGTASLDKRLDAARAIADNGGIVGFHFHPMVHYDRWREDYGEVIDRLTNRFSPREVALVSLGTLTFIKPVMREIRERGVETQILKMPMDDAAGKYSYPDDIKIELFSHAYDRFPAHWRDEVFFYLCMEDPRFWQPVFGFDWDSNDAFERAMKSAYMEKIRTRQPPLAAT